MRRDCPDADAAGGTRVSATHNRFQNRPLNKGTQRRKHKALWQRLERVKHSLIAAILQAASRCEDAGELEFALANYSAVLDVDASHALAHLRRGAILMQQGAWTESIAAFEAALRLNPKDALAYVYLGQVLDKAGQADSAA